MRPLQPAGRALRGVALLALGALAVHQLTYLLAGGAHLHAVAGADRHTYLAELAPALAWTSAAAIALSLGASAIRRRLPRALDPQCTTERAAAYGLALLAVYLTQELAEALVAGGGAPVLEATLGGGAWLALPLALGIGAMAAALGDILDRAEMRIALALWTRSKRPPRTTGAAAPEPRSALATAALAFGFSRRPPPLAVMG